jgi:hypothetical protein
MALKRSGVNAQPLRGIWMMRTSTLLWRMIRLLQNAGLLSMRVDGAARDVIQAPKPETRIMRYELSDYEWTAIKPMLPNKSRNPHLAAC